MIRHSGAGLNVVARKAEANKCDLSFPPRERPGLHGSVPDARPLAWTATNEQMNIEETSPYGAGLVSQGMDGVQIAFAVKCRGGVPPFVWQLARAQARCGDVCNDGDGVLVRLVEGRRRFYSRSG